MPFYTIHRGRFFYRRGPTPHWVTVWDHATTFRSESAAWAEADKQGFDPSEVTIEPFYGSGEEPT